MNGRLDKAGRPVGCGRWIRQGDRWDVNGPLDKAGRPVGGEWVAG